MSTYVVMEAQQGARKFLVWSLFDGGPGYSDVTYTTLEGEPVAHVDDDVRVTRFLFTVPGPEAPAPSDRVIFTTEYLAPSHGEVNASHAFCLSTPATGSWPSTERSRCDSTPAGSAGPRRTGCS